jgi:mannose-1-phosphate guanylyltransferase
MITVIIAGGSGTRLWPLSTHDKPKQLIKLLDGISPLQEAYDRVKSISSEVYIVPESRLIEDIKVQFPQFDNEHIIVEPGLRGTASCYLLALDTVTRNHSSEEPIAFIWADHHVRDVGGFQDSFELAAAEAVRQKRLVTVGIEPTYPAPLGYIERGREIEDSGVYEVISFKEKPDPEIAREYIRQGNYLWNSGYYIGTAETFLGAMERVAPKLYEGYQKIHAIKDQRSEEYKNTYLGFENTVIDVALSEKMNDLLVVPARFDWLDIGNFKDLHEASERDDLDNHFTGDNVYPIDVESVYIRNEENKPIAVIGLDNIIVVNTPDGILVARKDVSHRTGEVAKKLQSHST